MGQEFVLLVSASIFCVGTVGFIIRKNPLIMFMSVELMLNSVNFLLVAYSSFLNSLDGQIFALFIMTVAAAEVVVGLAIILTIFRTRHDMDVDHIDVFFVAPGDLAQTMGYPGQMYHPEVKKVVCDTLARIVASGRTAGSIVGEETFETHMDIGVKFFFTVYDHWLKTGAKAYLENAKVLENK